MTSQSRKKHRITRWNTLRSNPLNLFVAAAIVVSVLASASRASADTKSAATTDQPATTSEDLSPLEKLKQRSPIERWKQCSQDVFPATKSDPVSHGHSEPSTSTSAEQQTKGPTEAQNTASPAQPEKPIRPKAKERTGNTSQPMPRDRTKLLPTANGEGWYSQYITFQRQEPKPSPEPARDPKQLRKVTKIFPYRGYEPDADMRATDPCRNLCPRPDGQPCPTRPNSAVPTCPEEIQLSGEVYEGRRFTSRVYSWAASNVYHYPLYFEDVALERYGHTHHELIQPFVSVGKFGIQLVGLPYQMTIDPIRKKMYPLGWYRPGECAPKKFHLIPWNTEAALREAGVLTALIFIFP